MMQKTAVSLEKTSRLKIQSTTIPRAVFREAYGIHGMKAS
jgi:hypothetical protein